MTDRTGIDWTERPVLLAYGTGDRSVECHCVGGLAVHQEQEPDDWRVSQERSGAALVKGLPNKEAAVAVAAAMLALGVDWTVHPAELLKDRDHIRRLVEPIVKEHKGRLCPRNGPNQLPPERYR